MFSKLVKLIKRFFGTRFDTETEGVGYFFEFSPEELRRYTIYVDRTVLRNMKNNDNDYVREMHKDAKMIFDMELNDTGYIPYWNIRREKDGEFKLNLFTGIVFQFCKGASKTPIKRYANGWWVEKLPEHYIKILKEIDNGDYL